MLLAAATAVVLAWEPEPVVWAAREDADEGREIRTIQAWLDEQCRTPRKGG